MIVRRTVRRSSPRNGASFTTHLREADRLGLEMSLNIQSGWNLGGPMVTQDDAPKKLVWTETRVVGDGTNVSLNWCSRKAGIIIIATCSCWLYRVNPQLPIDRKPIQNHAQKALHDVLRRSPHQIPSRYSPKLQQRPTSRTRKSTMSSISPPNFPPMAHCHGKRRRAIGWCCVSVIL